MENNKMDLFDGMRCGMCAHDCQLANPSCRRGQTYAAEIYKSKMESLEGIGKAEPNKAMLSDHEI